MLGTICHHKYLQLHARVQHAWHEMPSLISSAARTGAACLAKYAIANISSGTHEHLLRQPKPKFLPTRRAETSCTSHPEKVNIVGSSHPVGAHATDSWGVLSEALDFPNELWIEDEGTSCCKIENFLHKHKLPEGGSHAAYAVSIDGYEGLYAVRYDTTA